MVDTTEIKKEGTLPIQVSKEVVGHLSRGLYRNFARAVKEIISNSYDAESTEVKIKLDLENENVIIRDNGCGMEIQEIENKFLTIGSPTPLEEKVDKLGRKRIGTFGIGFLSSFPYCKILQIITKKRNSDEIIELNIDTEQFFVEDTFLLEKVKVPYKIYESDLPKEKGETIIILKNIKPHIIHDLKQESVGKSSIDKLGGYQKFKWTLSQYAPIQFPPERKDLRDFFDDPDRIPMALWLDGQELFRNVPEEAIILEKNEKKFGSILLKYVVMTPKKPVEPEEARGLQMRLRDVAIGFPKDFDVIKFTGKTPGKLNYLCGEIHVLSGLESALMVDRDNFSYTQEVAEIEEFFRKKLNEWNDQLEKWAKGDKEVYGALQEIKASEKVINEFKKADVLHFSKDRLRLPKKPPLITKKNKNKPISSPSKKLIEAFAKREDFKVIPNKDKITIKDTPVQIIPEEKTIFINDQHPDFIEGLVIKGNKFKVSYGEWNPAKTPFSICKLDEQNKVVFNTTHPLFKSDISEEIIKKLALGIVLIAKKREDEEDLIRKLNHLLEEIFLGL